MNKINPKGLTLTEVIAILESIGIGYEVDRSKGFAVLYYGPANSYGHRNRFNPLKFSFEDICVGRYYSNW